MEQPPSLIADIDAFLETTQMSPVTFGRKALGDPHFVGQLRGGRRCWPETEAKARRFIEVSSAEGVTPDQADAA
jgi:hypothetical protein